MHIESNRQMYTHEQQFWHWYVLHRYSFPDLRDRLFVSPTPSPPRSPPPPRQCRSAAACASTSRPNPRRRLPRRGPTTASSWPRPPPSSPASTGRPPRPRQPRRPCSSWSPRRGAAPGTTPPSRRRPGCPTPPPPRTRGTQNCEMQPTNCWTLNYRVTPDLMHLALRATEMKRSRIHEMLNYYAKQLRRFNFIH